VPAEVRWRLRLASPPEQVWRSLATDEGRARFWGEEAVERDGAVAFRFPNGEAWSARILERDEPGRFALDYFGTPAVFVLEADGRGGTDLTLTHQVAKDWLVEVNAGWVSVLLALKAACDFAVDLRNHDAGRSWSQGYCDN
jgi:uncharacterized protein YndB with AHSA1/START domain